jgi:hypothetical protein
VNKTSLEDNLFHGFGGARFDMSQLDNFPGEGWGDNLLEQNLDQLVDELRRTLGKDKGSNEYAEKQLGGFGNSTQSLIVLPEEATLTDQRLQGAALSLLVYRGRIHLQTEEAHLHPDVDTNLFLLAGQEYEIQAVEPTVLIATFMRFD